MANSYKLVRRNKVSQTVEARPKGRHHPDFEYGFIDENHQFKLGNPPGKVNKGAASVLNTVDNFDEISKVVNSVIEKRVAARMKAVKEQIATALVV